MKSIRYLLISLVTVLAADKAMACWDPWYTAKWYYMYRVCSTPQEAHPAIDTNYPTAEENCRLWQSITSQDIPLQDICDVVYKMTLEEFESAYDGKQKARGNKFMEWIADKDTATLNFLLLAKTNEYIRLRRNSRWYYPSMKIGARMTLEDIAHKALAAQDKRLRERYLLQGIRALFSLGKYEECVQVWESEACALDEDNLMRRLIQPYIAGAEFRLNHSRKAMEYFAQIGDTESMLFCAGRTGEKLSRVDAIELVCEYAPQSQYIPKALQAYIRSIEPLGGYGSPSGYTATDQEERLYKLCLKMARNPRCRDHAMWYYTAAFLADLNGDSAGASTLLNQARGCNPTEYMSESIEVFRIYLDAKLDRYDTNYERKLHKQLKWLESKIVQDIDERVIQQTLSGYMLLNCQSYYYWNDMLRRILLSEVCPRMLQAGKKIRALQLANMANNMIYALTGQGRSMEELRYSEDCITYDYRNHFFEMIDSLGVQTAVGYVKNIQNPRSPFDTYLNSRGYTGKDYLNDIVGTQWLRNLQYGKALEYLETVSERYNSRLNVSIWYDPFSITRTPIQERSDFKYEFARQMFFLEQSISTTKDPNRKAQLMIRYATGMRNSFDWCWGLTQYYRGSCFWGQVCPKRDWAHDTLTETAREKVMHMVSSALEIVTDNYLAARLNYELCNFSTVANTYPDTPHGKLVRGQCDNLYDYHSERYSSHDSYSPDISR